MTDAKETKIDVNDIPICPTITYQDGKPIRHAPPPFFTLGGNWSYIRDENGNAWQVFRVEGKLWKMASIL
jgi:hypothetical protein